MRNTHDYGMTEWAVIAKFFGLYLLSFLEDFARVAFEVLTEGDDGKVRKSWFYRGFYITHKWKKDENGQWYQFWTQTSRNPHAKRKSASVCKECPNNVNECRSPKNCEANIERHGERKLNKLLWNAEDNDDRIDYREDRTINACVCIVFDDVQEKPQDMIFPEVDPIPEMLEKIEYQERKAKIVKGIMALNKRDLESFYAKQNDLITWMDNIQADEFRKILKEENLLILTKDGKFNIVKGNYPVTDGDTSNSLKHMRDVLRIDLKILRESKYKTLTGYLAGLEKKTLSVIPKDRVSIKINDNLAGGWTVYGKGMKKKVITKKIAISNNIPTLWKMLGKELMPNFKFEALIEPRKRLTYDLLQSWDYGMDDGITDDQIKDLVMHFNGTEGEDNE